MDRRDPFAISSVIAFQTALAFRKAVITSCSYSSLTVQKTLPEYQRFAEALFPQVTWYRAIDSKRPIRMFHLLKSLNLFDATDSLRASAWGLFMNRHLPI